MIGKNERRFESAKFLLERAFGINALEREPEPASLKRMLNQHCVPGLVLDHQDAQFRFDKKLGLTVNSIGHG